MLRLMIILHWILAIVIALASVYALFHLVQTGALATGAFAGGLAAIGFAMALLGVPVSLKITKPLERLEHAALRIAQGDLSARATLNGRHVIGKKLAHSFNTMAETVERMVRGGKELTANMSHELRSPLARIRIAGECLKEALERGDAEDAQEMLRAMWEDIEEADRMIGRILEFSKVDLHEPMAVSGPVAPAEIIERLVKTLAPLARSRQIELSLELDREIHTAGNDEWLRAALKNLLENALRYTVEGGTVRVAVKGGEGGVMVEVTNTHPPLEPEELELIFKPFYRGRNSQSEGTGLGLSIVQKIVELHHGTLGARNVPEGFQVWVRLPAITQP